MDSPAAYIPIDRQQALARGESLPERDTGAALFADISGFTPLTEALALELGPKRGAEELAVHLNRVYEALIAELFRYGGSVVSFAGDAITCWFGGDDGRRAVAAGLGMQQAMRQFAEVRTHSGRVVSLGVKVAVTAGAVRRFVAGDPTYLLVDVMAGATLERLSAAEHRAERGDVVVDGRTAQGLGTALQVAAWRGESASYPADGDRRGGPSQGLPSQGLPPWPPGDESVTGGPQRPRDETYEGWFAVAAGLNEAPAEARWPPLAPEALSEDQVRGWVLPRVYERLDSGQGEFLAELRPAVALFLRFSGIDYDGDEGAPARLDGFLREIEAILLRYDGSLLQLTVGDKGSYLYAAFGAPIAHENDAARAGSAALELQALAARLGYLDPLQIGITQGRMRTGAYGSATQRTYGVLGDATNLSARLMMAAEPGEILVSELARQAMGDAFAWELRPPIRVKGKSQPVAVARLVGPRNQPTLRLAEPRYALPMVGREAELALIGAKRRLAWRGRGQIVGITAEAGMGKSRLAAEAIRLAYLQGFAGYGGECQSYGTNTSYLVWHTIWRGLFGLQAERSLEEQIRALAERLRSIEPSFVPRLPLLGPALNLTIPDNDFTRAFDAKLRKTSLEALLVDCLAAFAREKPLLLVLEDCHWLDPLSADLLEQVGRSIANLPVLMLLAYRPPDVWREQAPRVERLPYFTEIALADFTPEEAERLIGLKLAQFSGAGEAGSAPAELVQRIAERASGNPFYIEELLNYIHDRGIAPGDAAALESLDLPASLYSLILARIDQLDEAQKLTIKVASVIGRLFRAAMIWGVMPELGPSRVQSDLQVLSRLELTPLDTPDPELVYLFKHVLTQQVAYESLLYATRAMLHEQIGAFIERTYRETIDRYLDLLAYHYDYSENQPKRREYLRRAGDATLAGYANAAAADYYQRLLPLLHGEDQLETLLRLGQALKYLARWGEAEEVGRRALELAVQLGDQDGQARACHALGRLRMLQGDYREALTWLARGRAAFEAAADPPGAAAVLCDVAYINMMQGDNAVARAGFEQAILLADSATEPRVRREARARALHGASTVAARQGEYAAARAFGEEGLDIYREYGNRPAIVALLGAMGQVFASQGDWAAAQRAYEESLAISREIGDRYSMGQGLSDLAFALAYQGRGGEARAWLAESIAIRRQLGDQAGLALSLLNLAETTIDDGDYAGARPLLAESLSLAHRLGDRWLLAYLVEDYAAVAAAGGRPDRSWQLAGFAASLRRGIGAALAPPEQSRLDRLLTPARAALDEASASTAWAAGQALSLEEAIALAASNGAH